LVKFLKKSMDNDTKLYYRFLFSIWPLCWQNKKIEKILKEMHEKVLDYLKKEIVLYFQNTNLRMSSESSSLVSLYLMFLMDGTIFHLLLEEKYNSNAQLWEIIKKSLNQLISL